MFEEFERFSAIHDLKTSKVCQRHDGSYIEVGKGIIGETIPPLHPHCRLDMIPVISKEVTDSLMRRERDVVTGKDSIVPANETYPQWLERQQYDRYKDFRCGKKAPISLDKFQDLKYNDVESFKHLRTQLKDKKLQTEIQYDKYNKTILEGKQGKHILGHNN